MASKIRKNDKVVVLTGKDKGKIGKVLSVLNNNKVVIEGINIVYKHKKSVPEKNQTGGIIQIESPIDISNIALFNDTINKADRVGFKFINGKKVRFFKSNNAIIK
ncbi:50S ribosomal protein L24 [Buchnera aphidicola (Thelaxes suberi)]|uniref:50S ribosomal protein L24 n=1 Tax=Buchnera aphidicola TaxID=9 RepID=UPI003463A845